MNDLQRAHARIVDAMAEGDFGTVRAEIVAGRATLARVQGMPRFAVLALGCDEAWKRIEFRIEQIEATNRISKSAPIG